MPAFTLLRTGPGSATQHLLTAEGKPFCGEKLGEEVPDAALVMTVKRCEECRRHHRLDADDNWSGKA